MVTGRVWRSSPVVSFHSITKIVLPVAGTHELVTLIEVVALPFHLVAAIVDSSVSAAIHKRVV